jgi:hypothetical protein
MRFSNTKQIAGGSELKSLGIRAAGRANVRSREPRDALLLVVQDCSMNNFAKSLVFRGRDKTVAVRGLTLAQ